MKNKKLLRKKVVFGAGFFAIIIIFSSASSVYSVPISKETKNEKSICMLDHGCYFYRPYSDQSIHPFSLSLHASEKVTVQGFTDRDDTGKQLSHQHQPICLPSRSGHPTSHRLAPFSG